MGRLKMNILKELRALKEMSKQWLNTGPIDEPRRGVILSHAQVSRIADRMDEIEKEIQQEIKNNKEPNWFLDMLRGEE